MNIWQALGRLFATLSRITAIEARSIRNILIFILASPIVIILIRVVSQSTQITAIFAIAFAAITIFLTFRVRRLLGLATIGEAIESIGLTPNQPGISNTLVSEYISAAATVSLFSVFVATTTPFVPFERAPESILLFPVLCYIILFTIGWFSQSLLRFIFGAGAIISCSLLLILIAGQIWPQIRAQLPLQGFFQGYILTHEQSSTLNKIDNTMQRRFNLRVQHDIEKVEQWVEQNPYKDIPAVYEYFLQEIRSRKITLEQAKEELKRLDTRGSSNNTRSNSTVSKEEKERDAIVLTKEDDINCGDPTKLEFYLPQLKDGDKIKLTKDFVVYIKGRGSKAGARMVINGHMTPYVYSNKVKWSKGTTFTYERKSFKSENLGSEDDFSGRSRGV